MDTTKLKEKLPNRFLIIIVGNRNVGKTTTIKKIYRNIIDKYSGGYSLLSYDGNDPLNSRDDFYCVIKLEKSGTVIGIVSQGDTICETKRLLESLASFTPKIDIIICACRPDNPAVITGISPISYKYKYNPMWFELKNEFIIGSGEFINCIDELSNEVSTLLFESV